MRSISLAVALALGFSLSTPALAARADRRQVKQEARIAQGVADLPVGQPGLAAMKSHVARHCRASV